MGLSESGFFLIVLASLLPMLLVLGVFLLAGFYFIRRSEIGADLAGSEIKLSTVLLVVLVPSIFIFTYLFVLLAEPSNFDAMIYLMTAAQVAIVIVFPAYWWTKVRKAKESELFQVPVKATVLILFGAILWLFFGVFRIFVFFTSRSPDSYELILGLCYITLGLLLAFSWFRPTWHVTKEGVFWPLLFIEWELIVGQEWQPKNDTEVLLRLDIKRWWLPIKLPVTQAIPIDYERPLKAIIQKYAPQMTTTPPLEGEGSTV